MRKMSRIPALHFEPRNTLFSLFPVGHAFEPVGGADHLRVDGLDFFFFSFFFLFCSFSFLGGKVYFSVSPPPTILMSILLEQL